MKFSKVEQSATGTKDIGAFYGVNRTNKINDYQMSDMKNVDCESFPYLATRRARKLFYDKNKMAVICHDTDITDDYKVTGVTEDGGFVYRGEKLVDEGVSLDNTVTEFSGDYVLLPEKKYISVSASIGANGLPLRKATVKDFPRPCNDLLCEYCVRGMSPSSFSSELGDYFSVTSDRIECSFYYGGPRYVREHCMYIINNFHPGMFFKLKLMARNGTPKKNGYTEYVCDIPDDICMVIDEMYICKNEYDLERNKKITYCYYGDEQYSIDTLFTFLNRDWDYNDFVIKFSAKRESTGELYDISKHFKQYNYDKSYTLKSVNEFVTGSADCKLLEQVYYWNDLYILPEFPVMLGGVHYNGRFFAYDNMGVDIYYSPSGNGSDKYDFTFGESLAGAGVVSCADSGKWTALKSYNGALYAFKKNGMYRIYSSDGLSFYMDKVADVGAVSRNAVAIVSDVMYFLSETGLYRFTGTYPEELPDNLGRRYTDGVLGGYDNKVYCSLSHSGGRELVVYDAQVNAYGVHDEFDAVNFVTYGGKLYGLDASSGCVYEMSGERESLEFSINTRKFFLGFNKKAINGIRLYFDYENQPGEKFEVLVSYDGGEWEPCFKPITSGKLKYVPIKFKKCDELSVSIRGTGIFTLKGMTLNIYSGGDIRQNK